MIYLHIAQLDPVRKFGCMEPLEACENCGKERVAYNSCRNRHCPKCGAIEKEKWIINREADLLPVKYFHVVFTVPDKLNSLFLNNQVAMYNLLFFVVWDVMKDFGKTKKWIGGEMVIIKTIPNRFIPGKRPPPGMKTNKALDYCIIG